MCIVANFLKRGSRKNKLLLLKIFKNFWGAQLQRTNIKLWMIGLQQKIVLLIVRFTAEKNIQKIIQDIFMM